MQKAQVKRKRNSSRRVLKVQWIGLLVVLIAGVCLVTRANVDSASAQSSNTVQVSSTTPIPTRVRNKYPPGISAIKPHLVAINGSTPTFTAADAQQYVTSFPFLYTRAKASGTFTITQVKFMTSGALSNQLNGESIGRPDTSLVCYVELQGTFLFTGIEGSLTAHTAYEVFDAQTGNLILVGGKVR